MKHTSQNTSVSTTALLAQQPHQLPNRADICGLIELIEANAKVVFPKTTSLFQRWAKDRAFPREPFTVAMHRDNHKGYQAVLMSWQDDAGATGEFRPQVDQARASLMDTLGDVLRETVLAAAGEEPKSAAERGRWVTTAFN